MIAAVFCFHIGAQTSLCLTPPFREDTDGSSWSRDVEVNVVINPTSFPPGSPQYDAVIRAFNNWQSANGPSGNNSGVKFKFTTGTTGSLGVSNQIYVTRGSTRTGASNTTYLDSARTTVTGADIIIDSSVTATDSITGFLAHEIGETFGLGDCSNCPSGSTIMAPPTCVQEPCSDFNNRVMGSERPGLQGPRTCDNNKVKESNYPLPAPTPTPLVCQPPPPCNPPRFIIVDCQCELN